MKYTYFPGCSLEGANKSFDMSAKIISKLLNIELEELEDWNCCGATSTSCANEILTYTLCARNIAIAEKKDCDVAIACSGCYKNLHTTNEFLRENPDIKEKINLALKEDNLTFKGKNKIKHLLDIVIKDVGLENVKKHIKVPLDGLKVATYYGCQTLRPLNDYGKYENPTHFEELIKTLGATPVHYPLKTVCCGATMILTHVDIALKLVKNLIQCAYDNGAEMIITPCPMCQLNLDAYQKRVNKMFNTNYSMPVVYFTQLMGVAYGQPLKKLGIGQEIIPAKKVLSRFAN